MVQAHTQDERVIRVLQAHQLVDAAIPHHRLPDKLARLTFMRSPSSTILSGSLQRRPLPCCRQLSKAPWPLTCQLKHMQRSLWLRVRGDDAESRMVSMGEIATQQGLTTGQSLATARVVVRFDALKQQDAHNASMGSQVKFREGSGASMVEDLVAAFALLAGFALQHVPLEPVYCVDVLVPNMGVGHRSSGVGPCQWQEDELVDTLGRESGARPPSSVAGKVPFSG